MHLAGLSLSRHLISKTSRRCRIVGPRPCRCLLYARMRWRKPLQTQLSPSTGGLLPSLFRAVHIALRSLQPITRKPAHPFQTDERKQLKTATSAAPFIGTPITCKLNARSAEQMLTLYHASKRWKSNITQYGGLVELFCWARGAESLIHT